MEASSIAKATGDRLSNNSAGQQRSRISEAPLAIATLPAKPALLQLCLLMLTGGSGALAALTEHYKLAAATLELIVLMCSHLMCTR